MSDTQKKIDINAQKILDIFDGESSSLCVLSMISVFEHLTDSEKATAAFRKQASELLEVQAFRIKVQMRVQGVS